MILSSIRICLILFFVAIMPHGLNGADTTSVKKKSSFLQHHSAMKPPPLFMKKSRETHAATFTSEPYSYEHQLSTDRNLIDTDPGLTARYFYKGSALYFLSGIDFDGTPTFTSYAPNIDYMCDVGTFSDSGYSDYFGVSFEGFLTFPSAGTYTFFLSSDDGSSLLLNGTEIIDNDGLHDLLTKTASYTVSYPLTVDFNILHFENAGEADLRLEWSYTGVNRTIVPPSAFTQPKMPSAMPSVSSVPSVSPVPSTLPSTSRHPSISPSSIPSLTPCDPSEMTVVLELQTDNYAHETSWTLTNLESGNIVNEVQYGYADDETYFEYRYCILPIFCHKFEMNDSYGDGIFSTSGYYKLIVDETVLLTSTDNNGGDFDYGEEVTFGCSPSSKPSNRPSVNLEPSDPSSIPSSIPSSQPSSNPSLVPSSTPTMKPTSAPSSHPSSNPSLVPSRGPTMVPTSTPSSHPSISPSVITSTSPSVTPSLVPSQAPSLSPSTTHSTTPSASPSQVPSSIPSLKPSSHPSSIPSLNPSLSPSMNPSLTPSFQPTDIPSVGPSSAPSSHPSAIPSLEPSVSPSTTPTSVPSLQPSISVSFGGIIDAYSLYKGQLSLTFERPELIGELDLDFLTYDLFVVVVESKDSTKTDFDKSIPSLIEMFDADINAGSHFQISANTLPTNVLAVDLPDSIQNRIVDVFMSANYDGTYSTNSASSRLHISNEDPLFKDSVNVVGLFVPILGNDTLLIAVDDIVPSDTSSNHYVNFTGGPFTNETEGLQPGDYIIGFDSVFFKSFLRRVDQKVSSSSSEIVYQVKGARFTELYESLDLSACLSVSRRGTNDTDAEADTLSSVPQGSGRNANVIGASWQEEASIDRYLARIAKDLGKQLEYEKQDVYFDDTVTLAMDLSLKMSIQIKETRLVYADTKLEADYSGESDYAADAGSSNSRYLGRRRCPSCFRRRRLDGSITLRQGRRRLPSSNCRVCKLRRHLLDGDPTQGRRHLRSGNCNHCRFRGRRRLQDVADCSCKRVYSIHGELTFACQREDQFAFMSIGWDSIMNFLYSEEFNSDVSSIPSSPPSSSPRFLLSSSSSSSSIAITDNDRFLEVGISDDPLLYTTFSGNTAVGVTFDTDGNDGDNTLRHDGGTFIEKAEDIPDDSNLLNEDGITSVYTTNNLIYDMDISISEGLLTAQSNNTLEVDFQAEKKNDDADIAISFGLETAMSGSASLAFNESVIELEPLIEKDNHTLRATVAPSDQPSLAPSALPSVEPSMSPSMSPSLLPSGDPSDFPSMLPSSLPSSLPSIKPSVSLLPSTIYNPSSNPSLSLSPSLQPSKSPSNVPSIELSNEPSFGPTSIPSTSPSLKPSARPSLLPSHQPSPTPSTQPSLVLSLEPSAHPSLSPSFDPSLSPSSSPTEMPSSKLTLKPSLISIPATIPVYFDLSKSQAAQENSETAKGIGEAIFYSGIGCDALSNDPVLLEIKMGDVSTSTSVCDDDAVSSRIVSMVINQDFDAEKETNTINAVIEIRVAPDSGPSDTEVLSFIAANLTENFETFLTLLNEIEGFSVESISDISSGPIIFDGCVEHPDDIFALNYKKKGGNIIGVVEKKCSWLAKKSANRIAEICNNHVSFKSVERAWDVCVQTCGRCNVSPSSPPSQAPSQAVSIEPTIEWECEEDSASEFAIRYTYKKGQIKGVKTKTCGQLKAARHELKTKWCKTDVSFRNVKRAYDVCVISCGRCEEEVKPTISPSMVPSSNPTSSCSDSDGKFGASGKLTCTIIRKYNTAKREKKCKKENISKMCQLTCGICCKDDPKHTFIYKDRERGCKWLAGETPNKIDKVCDKFGSSLQYGCIETCGKCYTSPSSISG